MEFKPHAYQRYAIDYIIKHPVAALFLDMGLGKTVTTLTAIEALMHDRFTVSRVLVIAPLRVARDTWPDEIEKWDHLHLSYAVAVGSAKERRQAIAKDADLTIINRENVPWLIEHFRWRWDMVVIDELSSFKNYRAKRHKALMRVRPRMDRIVGLTGTPSPNGLMDLFAEFKLLDGGKRLGRFITGYRATYFDPDKRNSYQVFSYKPKPDAEEAIYERIGDITVSMRATEHLAMPQLIASEVMVRMDARERGVYHELKKNLVLEIPDGEITATGAAALSGKLQQLAGGALYRDDGQAPVVVHDRKLEALEEIVEAAAGKPFLLAYWYRHEKERITAKLEALGATYGIISEPGVIQRWNAGDLSVGLIHPASAGHGLNLQAGGCHIVWYGPIWSLELYQQTNARLYRQGQKSRTVVVQHIVTKNTIDTQILAALRRKDQSQSALIAAVKAEIGVKND